MDPKNPTPGPASNAALQMLELLRDPEKGCPWLSSRRLDELLPYFLEELHEYRQALRQGGLASPQARHELADLVFQVLLHSTLLKEQNGVGFEELCQDVVRKLERRHPHVFDPSHPRFASAEEAGRAWEELKLAEARADARQAESTESRADKLERIPDSLPALQRASRIGEKTESFGFDWKSPDEVLVKVREEMRELEEARSLEDKAEELGDLLFSLAQYARHLRLPPEELADRANHKFLRRFRKTESLVRDQGLDWDALSPSEKEAFWRQAKWLNP